MPNNTIKYRVIQLTIATEKKHKSHYSLMDFNKKRTSKLTGTAIGKSNAIKDQYFIGN